MSEPNVFFVATPIGNLDEITFRAVDTLKSADVIYCEDTRHTLILLKRYGINKPLVAYHKFNEKGMAQRILSDAESNKKIAIVTDAGMPCVSDPGNILVKQLIEHGILYTVVSGASAFVNAFVISGFSAPFTFIGFLPEKNIDKDRLIEGLSKKSALIFYSSVHNINQDLEYLFSKLGKREACVVRELTKLYESIYFGKLGELLVVQTKGEFVIVIDRDDSTGFEDTSIEEHINIYLKQGLPKTEAVKRVAKERGIPKNEVYQVALKME